MNLSLIGSRWEERDGRRRKKPNSSTNDLAAFCSPQASCQSIAPAKRSFGNFDGFSILKQRTKKAPVAFTKHFPNKLATHFSR